MIILASVVQVVILAQISWLFDEPALVGDIIRIVLQVIHAVIVRIRPCVHEGRIQLQVGEIQRLENDRHALIQLHFDLVDHEVAVATVRVEALRDQRLVCALLDRVDTAAHVKVVRDERVVARQRVEHLHGGH